MSRYALLGPAAVVAVAAFLPTAAGAAPAPKPARRHAARSGKRAPRRPGVMKPPLLPPAQVRARDKQRSNLLASTKPDMKAVKDLDNEREAIFQWVRATIGDPGAVAVAQAGPSREAVMAVEVARVEVAAAEKSAQRAREIVGEGLI